MLLTAGSSLAIRGSQLRRSAVRRASVKPVYSCCWVETPPATTLEALHAAVTPGTAGRPSSTAPGGAMGGRRGTVRAEGGDCEPQCAGARWCCRWRRRCCSCSSASSRRRSRSGRALSASGDYRCGRAQIVCFPRSNVRGNVRSVRICLGQGEILGLAKLGKVVWCSTSASCCTSVTEG